ncbi:transcriptional regulator, LysR family [Vannielia litorea]|uniref:Transcriptional regulator, LysR family n=2 Tax=Vannielia litorea TaxID=1217970 RepID=A0A1N6E0D8_9RHOB|nr:transcriptional regulator, LysR family [Vannielia litorea]
MEMHQLRYFVAVAEELHFGRAAQRENVSQPPLSLQIKKLEEELGVLLLERTKRRVRLTEAGAAFLPEARSILATAKNAKHMALQAHRGEIGQVRLGFVHSASLGYLPQLVEPFRKAFPLVKICLEEMTVTEQVEALHDGSIDIGIVRPLVEMPEWESFQVVREGFTLVVPVTHAMAGQDSVDLRSLRDENFVFTPEHRSPAFYSQLMRIFAKSGFVPKVVVEANTVYTTIGLVGTGAGLGILPESVSCVQIPSVRFVPIRNTSETAELQMVYQPDRLTNSARKMVDFAKALAKHQA